jgi:hypothetical protein
MSNLSWEWGVGQMDETVVPARLPAGATVRRLQRLRRTVATVLGVGAALLVAGAGFAFLNTNGTATTAVTAGGTAQGNFADVYTASPPVAWALAGGTGSPQSAQWTPVLNSVSTVTQAGDLAIVDATGTSGNILVTVALTNPAALSGDYAYMNLPIVVKACTLSGSTCTWQDATDANGNAIGASAPQYLTLTNGYLTFLLQGGTGKYYEIEIATGGSFFTISTTAGSLSPAFLVTTAAAG